VSADALLSSARQDWRTPDWFLDLVRQVGPIALDPATHYGNPTGADAFFAHLPPDEPVRSMIAAAENFRGGCGLSGSWWRSGLAFVNPPYGAHLSGDVDPAYEHTKKHEACDGGGCTMCGGRGRLVTGIGRGWARRIAADRGEWIALVPTRSDAQWWHDLHAACAWGVFWRSPTYGSRIQFVNPDTGRPKQGSTLASSVFYHGPNVARFLEIFGPHGRPFPGW
jgi:hypothetical protein